MGKKAIDQVEAYKILSSTAPRDVKLRQLSQLQYGNRKMGTMAAKQMYDNYINRKTPQEQTRAPSSIPSLTPEQQQQMNELVSMLTKSKVDDKGKEKVVEEEIDMDALS